MIQVLARELGPVAPAGKGHTLKTGQRYGTPCYAALHHAFVDLDPRRAEWPFGADRITEMRVERVIGPKIGLRQVFDLE